MAASANNVFTIQRQHPRVDLSQPVAIQIPDWSVLGAECLNVSHGGMRLRLQQRIRVGDRMLFRAEIPGSGSFELEAEVRHVSRVDGDHFDVGICWLDADVRAVYLFETLVRDHLLATPSAA